MMGLTLLPTPLGLWVKEKVMLRLNFVLGRQGERKFVFFLVWNALDNFLNYFSKDCSDAWFSIIRTRGHLNVCVFGHSLSSIFLRFSLFLVSGSWDSTSISGSIVFFRFESESRNQTICLPLYWKIRQQTSAVYNCFHKLILFKLAIAYLHGKRQIFVLCTRQDKKTEGENYRPISLTPILAKVQERCALNRLLLHVSPCLFNMQHDFLKGLSCTNQLLQVLHELCQALDGGLETDVIYLDFSKAFDSMFHAKLLLKLCTYSILGLMVLCCSGLRVVFLVDNNYQNYVWYSWPLSWFKPPLCLFSC